VPGSGVPHKSPYRFYHGSSRGHHRRR
jgi:hypothetical protein